MLCKLHEIFRLKIPILQTSTCTYVTFFISSKPHNFSRIILNSTKVAKTSLKTWFTKTRTLYVIYPLLMSIVKISIETYSIGTTTRVICSKSTSDNASIDIRSFEYFTNQNISWILLCWRVQLQYFHLDVHSAWGFFGQTFLGWTRHIYIAFIY